MISLISLKNFKCFKEQTLEIAPLTLLSGLNGMGKSSLIQSLLLLRQSFSEKVLDKGISLNGDLINLGTGRDLLYERAESESIVISLEIDGRINLWTYDYNAESNFLPLISQNLSGSLEEITLFTDRFQYLCADRLGPRNTFAKSNHKVVQQKQLGIKGEYTQHYLYVYGRDVVHNEKVKHPSVDSPYLINQVQGWMDVISPGIRIETQDFSQTDLIGMQYRFAEAKELSNHYRPTNVGFGITYVLPVVVALLKAQKGDLVIIENPEAHLHPRGQRYLGELLSRTASGGVQVIVETHSDHILNGVRLSVRKEHVDNDHIRLHFFEKAVLNNQSIHRVQTPYIQKDGRIDYWPDGFFDEWDKALDEFF